MNVNDLTIGEAKELANLFGSNKQQSGSSSGLCSMLNKKVIIRTYSAGVWFGLLSQKDGEEVILEDARRMYRWWASESISLSAVAIYGVKHDKSKIVEAVPGIWLKAIEILPCSNVAIKSLEEAENVKAE